METLGLPDLIRMNKLVRGRIQVDAFESWYAGLGEPDRRALMYGLAAHAFEAGVDEDVARRARELTPGALDCAGAMILDGVAGSSARRLSKFHAWMKQAEPASLHVAFGYVVALFGIAEGRVFAAETEGTCNHWWHRDLLDPAVEDDLFQDPQFHRTSMRTDRQLRRKR
jgi:hypothetical protein